MLHIFLQNNKILIIHKFWIIIHKYAVTVNDKQHIYALNSQNKFVRIYYQTFLPYIITHLYQFLKYKFRNIIKKPPKKFGGWNYWKTEKRETKPTAFSRRQAVKTTDFTVLICILFSSDKFCKYKVLFAWKARNIE